MNTLRIVASGAGGGSGGARSGAAGSLASRGPALSEAARLSSASKPRIMQVARRVAGGKGLTARDQAQGFKVTRPRGGGAPKLTVPKRAGGGGAATGRQIQVG